MSGLLSRFGARLVFSNRAISKHLIPRSFNSPQGVICLSTVQKTRYQPHNVEQSSRGLDKTDDITRLEHFLRKQRLKGALYSSKENAKFADKFWEDIIEAGDVLLAERYLNMRVRLGLHIDAEKVLKDMREASMLPTARIYGVFIHQSCAVGDMNQTNSYLRLLRDAGLRPNSYIFSQILHGYVKAGLPEEVSSTQELLSEIGLWPSRYAYEGLLSAYADLGDKQSLLRILDEAYTVLPSLVNSDENHFGREISPTFLMDLYTRINCSQSDSNATCIEILEKLPSTDDFFPYDFAQDTVKVLLAKGRPAAALEVFKIMRPENATEGYLHSLPLYAATGGLNSEALEPFWEAARLDSKQLMVLKNKCKLYFNRSNRPPSTLANQFSNYIEEKNVEAAIDMLKDLNRTNSPIVYTFMVPKLMRLGYSLTDLIERVQNPEINGALAFGYVLNSVLSIDSKETFKEDLKKCLSLVNEYRAKKLLPYTDFIRVGNYQMEKLLSNILSLSDMSEIEEMNKSTIMFEVFGILNHAMSKREFHSLFAQIFEALLISKHRHFNNVPKNTVIQLVADACARQNIVFDKTDWLLSAMRSAGVSEETLIRLTVDYSTNRLPFADLNTLLFSGRIAGIGSKSNEKSSTTVGQMSVSPKESILSVAQSLVRLQKENPSEYENKLNSIENSWGIQKKSILILNLVNLGAEDLVERTIQYLPENQREKSEPLKRFAHIIRVCSASDANKTKALESVKETIQSLTGLPSEDLFNTLRGPHMDTLFRCWPVDHVSDLIVMVKKVSELGLNSVSLQLAGVLINRGLVDQVSALLGKNTTIPFTFLVGSPRHPLTESAFHSTMEYIKTNDPKHIPGFVDYTLRNAALSNNEDNLHQLIRTAVSPAYNVDLTEICILPTLQVICNRLEESKNLPADVLQATRSIVEKYQSSKQKVSK
uniref:Pentacotripeptide-repeat region of PRORP domain-containing protein n=1 Tax=Trichobilharzia regenti TaxID=157069 RepID=A0AA85JHT4_TRIRE|nr:unnamed protein product [Trichobilharzia regenti]